MGTQLRERSLKGLKGPDGDSFHCVGADMVTVRFF